MKNTTSIEVKKLPYNYLMKTLFIKKGMEVNHVKIQDVLCLTSQNGAKPLKLFLLPKIFKASVIRTMAYWSLCRSKEKMRVQ